VKEEKALTCSGTCTISAAALDQKLTQHQNQLLNGCWKHGYAPECLGVVPLLTAFYFKIAAEPRIADTLQSACM